ncbi:hypothetical protein Pcinc_034393 [Petrolisthes cinctipes]|uniref:Uncharacterized protein n=1 Tax=Petrolisthes cinctipes TaxID=88211 RepID=A0AAE1BW46_PETCI|nr:hypothetical protein Pcinc_037634 [Petrolisthes cinctipes]KAK3859502.1 hypothetical protein Pcinc_034393 [Petrolisthes cinctipes]
MTNPEETNDRFYEELDTIITAVPQPGIELLDDMELENVTAMASFCSEPCSMFRLPNRNKTSWMHPRSKHCISTESWETLATDRLIWCSHIQQGAKRAEEERTKTAEKKR